MLPVLYYDYADISWPKLKMDDLTTEMNILSANKFITNSPTRVIPSIVQLVRLAKLFNLPKQNS